MNLPSILIVIMNTILDKASFNFVIRQKFAKYLEKVRNNACILNTYVMITIFKYVR